MSTHLSLASLSDLAGFVYQAGTEHEKVGYEKYKRNVNILLISTLFIDAYRW